MKTRDRKRMPCAACGRPVGNATIVAGGAYPNAPLCFPCGGTESSLSSEQVQSMIACRAEKKEQGR